MIWNDNNYFQGHFNGNNHRIYVDINSNNIYVGLFSQIRGPLLYQHYNNYLIEYLTIDGKVQGGPNSQYVGGFAGYSEWYF